MAQEQQLPEIKLDISQLYREEIFTDRKAGTLRRLYPVLADGNTDASRPVLYSGQTQLLTPAGVLPLAFELEATSLEDACNKFPDAVKVAIEQAIEEAREMRREAASRIVVPEGRHGRTAGGRRRAHQALMGTLPISWEWGRTWLERRRASGAHAGTSSLSPGLRPLLTPPKRGVHFAKTSSFGREHRQRRVLMK